MREQTLEVLAPLLRVLRAYPVLDEVRSAAFHLNGSDFIHFHDGTPEGLVADVRLASGRVRLPVSTPPQQAELLERIETKLIQLEERSERAGSRRHGRTSAFRE